eukprot:12334435-Heterocapsa_arctica.AAC.1
MAFEWACRADGWKVQAMESILQGLDVRCNFDGCCYGLKTDAQILLKKPWRVQANLELLRTVLNKQCIGGHAHDDCRGRNAARSGLYTDDMVHNIGMAITGGDNRAVLGALTPIEGAASSSADLPTYLRDPRGR